MKDIEQLKKAFMSEYSAAFKAAGNNLAVGIGKDAKTGQDTIEVRLTNDKLKSDLPSNYHGAPVNVIITGPIFAL